MTDSNAKQAAFVPKSNATIASEVQEEKLIASHLSSISQEIHIRVLENRIQAQAQNLAIATELNTKRQATILQLTNENVYLKDQVSSASAIKSESDNLARLATAQCEQYTSCLQLIEGLIGTLALVLPNTTTISDFTRILGYLDAGNTPVKTLTSVMSAKTTLGKATRTTTRLESYESLRHEGYKYIAEKGLTTQIYVVAPTATKENPTDKALNQDVPKSVLDARKHLESDLD